jgi:hypothetical protein
MKTWHITLWLAALVVLAAQIAAAQAQQAAPVVPKYDAATEATFKGTITDISDRNCPISGTMGFHFVLKLEDGKTIEVHVAASRFMKEYGLALNKGDQVEVLGSKVKFGGADTILAREVSRGEEVFVFRDKTGKPAW